MLSAWTAHCVSVAHQDSHGMQFQQNSLYLGPWPLFWCGARKEYNWEGISHSKINAHYIIDWTLWTAAANARHDHRLRRDTHKFIYRRRWRPHIALDVHRPLSSTYNPHKQHRMGLFSTVFVAWSTSTSFPCSLDSKPNLDPGLYLRRRWSCTELVGGSSKTLVAWSVYSRYPGREKDPMGVSRQ